MKTLLLAPLFLCTLAVTPEAYPDELPTGLFTLTLPDQAQAGKFKLERLAVLKTKDGFAIATRAGALDWNLLGTLKGPGALKLPATGDKPAGTLSITELKTDGGFAGTLKLGAETLSFEASEALNGGLYHCGNHTPMHLADSLVQMRELTDKKGCSDWDSNSSLAAHLDLSGFENLKASAVDSPP